MKGVWIRPLRCSDSDWHFTTDWFGQGKPPFKTLCGKQWSDLKEYTPDIPPDCCDECEKKWRAAA